MKKGTIGYIRILNASLKQRLSYRARWFKIPIKTGMSLCSPRVNISVGWLLSSLSLLINSMVLVVANMSYCRFQNTLIDLRDCMENLEDTDLSRAEWDARAELMYLMSEVGDYAEDIDQGERPDY